MWIKRKEEIMEDATEEGDQHPMTRRIDYDISMGNLWRLQYSLERMETLDIKYIGDVSIYMCKMLMLQQVDVMMEGHHKR